MAFSIVGHPAPDPSQTAWRRLQHGVARILPYLRHPRDHAAARSRTATASARSRWPSSTRRSCSRYFADVDPLAQRIVVEQLIPGVTRLGPPIEWQIVGVYRDIRNAGPRDAGFPEIDVPLAQSPWPDVSVAVRTAGDPASVQRSIADVVRGIDPDLPMVGVQTMEQLVDRASRPIVFARRSSAASAPSPCCSRRSASTA